MKRVFEILIVIVLLGMQSELIAQDTDEIPYNYKVLYEMVIIEHKDSIQERNKLEITILNKDSSIVHGKKLGRKELRREISRFICNLGKNENSSENPSQATLVLDFQENAQTEIGIHYLKFISSVYEEVKNTFSNMVYNRSYCDLGPEERANLDFKCPARVILAYVEGLHCHKPGKLAEVMK